MRAKLGMLVAFMMIASTLLVALPAMACHSQTTTCEDASVTDYNMQPDNYNIEPSAQTVVPGGSHEYLITSTLGPGCGSIYYLYTSLSTVPAGWSVTYMDGPGRTGNDVSHVDGTQCGSGNNVVIKGYVNVTAPTQCTEGMECIITAMQGIEDNACNDKDLVYVKLTTRIHIPDPPPVINKPVDPFTMPEDTEDSTHVNLTSVFRDTDNDPMVYFKTDNPNIDIKLYQTGKVVIKPKPDWNGEETLTFTASDLITQVSSTVTVTVTPVEDPVLLTVPIKEFFIPKDGEDSSTVDLNKVFTDADTPYGDLLTFTVAGYTNITTTIKADGKVRFQPRQGWAGNETITFTATDKAGSKAATDVKVTVTDNRRPPVVVNHLADRSFPEDTVDTSIDLGTVFASPDLGTVLTFGTMGSDFINISITDAGKVTLTPYKDAHGSAQIAFWAYDGMFAPVYDSAQVTVTPVNDPPYIKKDLNITMNEDYPSDPVYLESYFGDVDGDKLTFTVTAPSELTVQVSSTTTEMTMTSKLNWNGETTINIKASDKESDITMKVPVTVRPIDDPPIIISATPPGNTVATDGDKVEFSVEAMDIDGETLGATWMIDNNFTILKGFNGKLSAKFTANALMGCAAGSHTITVYVDGGQKSEAAHSWTLTVRPGNRPPANLAIRSPVANQTFTTANTVTFDAFTEDPDGDALSWTWYIDGTQKSTQQSFSTKLGAGTHTVKVSVTDGKNAAVESKELSITVTKAKTNPPANNGSPGFEALFLVAALCVAMALLRKRK